ncbi:MAG: hypothetical protein WD229_05665, partial [Pirellulales bacterium]
LTPEPPAADQTAIPGSTAFESLVSSRPIPDAFHPTRTSFTKKFTPIQTIASVSDDAHDEALLALLAEFPDRMARPESGKGVELSEVYLGSEDVQPELHLRWRNLVAPSK